MKAIDSAAGHALWFAWLLTLEATHGHIGAWREWGEALRVAALGLYMAYFACSLLKLAVRAKFMIPADCRIGRTQYSLQGLAR